MKLIIIPEISFNSNLSARLAEQINDDINAAMAKLGPKLAPIAKSIELLGTYVYAEGLDIEEEYEALRTKLEDTIHEKVQNHLLIDATFDDGFGGLEHDASVCGEVISIKWHFEEEHQSNSHVHPVFSKILSTI